MSAEWYISINTNQLLYAKNLLKNTGKVHYLWLSESRTGEVGTDFKDGLAVFFATVSDIVAELSELPLAKFKSEEGHHGHRLPNVLWLRPVYNLQEFKDKWQQEHQMETVILWKGTGTGTVQPLVEEEPESA